MRRVAPLIAILIAIVIGQAQTTAPITYHVTFPEPEHHWMQVEMTFTFVACVGAYLVVNDPKGPRRVKVADVLKEFDSPELKAKNKVLILDATLSDADESCHLDALETAGGQTAGPGGVYAPVLGALDEAGIWNRALSADEIKAIHDTATGSCRLPPDTTITAGPDGVTD